jgi:hypothetical protein
MSVSYELFTLLESLQACRTCESRIVANQLGKSLSRFYRLCSAISESSLRSLTSLSGPQRSPLPVKEAVRTAGSAEQSHSRTSWSESSVGTFFHPLSPMVAAPPHEAEFSTTPFGESRRVGISNQQRKPTAICPCTCMITKTLKYI